MFIRRANKEDSEFIYEWRNDPISREMSLDQGEINFNHHHSWFKKRIIDPNYIFFIGEINEVKIGICRFDYDPKALNTKVSINLNPSFRGKGLGKEFLINSIDLFENEKESNLSAQIKNNNIASQKIFEEAGFIQTRTDSEIILYEKKLKKINFKSVESDDSLILYQLLKNRKYSISHKQMPSYVDHQKFVNSQPYKYWYLIYEDFEVIGSFYIKEDNSIGLDLQKLELSILKRIIFFIKDSFSPSEPVLSKIPSYYYINLADSNKRLLDILKLIGCEPIQVSLRLN